MNAHAKVIQSTFEVVPEFCLTIFINIHNNQDNALTPEQSPSIIISFPIKRQYTMTKHVFNQRLQVIMNNFKSKSRKLYCRLITSCVCLCEWHANMCNSFKFHNNCICVEKTYQVSCGTKRIMWINVRRMCVCPIKLSSVKQF